MKLLLFGRDGQLGGFLGAALPRLGAVTALDRADIDLADAAAVRSAILARRPDVIVNAAAYTAVDQAESDAAAARAINELAPGAMAIAAKECGALLVHYSTDYVFDGAARAPYPENAPTNPLGVYGRTKLAGEEAIRESGADHLILRTAWLYSHTGKNFLLTMLRLARERDELRVVGDQTGCPTYAGNLAEATVKMLASLRDRGRQAPDLGTFHVTCNGQTTWFGFTQKILALAGHTRVKLTPITTADYPTPAARPAYSVLDNTRLAQRFGIVLPDWEEGLRQCMMEHGLAKQL